MTDVVPVEAVAVAPEKVDEVERWNSHVVLPAVPPERPNITRKPTAVIVSTFGVVASGSVYVVRVPDQLDQPAAFPERARK